MEIDNSHGLACAIATACRRSLMKLDKSACRFLLVEDEILLVLMVEDMLRELCCDSVASASTAAANSPNPLPRMIATRGTRLVRERIRRRASSSQCWCESSMNSRTPESFNLFISRED